MADPTALTRPAAKLVSETHPALWLRYAGVASWILVSITLVLISFLRTDDPVPASSMAGWWTSSALFILAFLHPAVNPKRPGSFIKRLMFLTLMTIAAFGVTYFTRSAIGIILGVVMTGILPWLLPRWLALAWLLGTATVFSIWIALLLNLGWLLVLVQLMMTLGLMVFAFAASLLALNQLKSRNELRRVNSELRATQTLLAENTRVAERVRIARELHDLVGHHLTALSLNLEVASHTTEGKPKQHVDRAGSIARLLLSDVREVVSDMRAEERVDLGEAIRELASGVPEPTIHIEIPSSLSLTDPKRAQILLRCAQEVITNAVRHAHANNLWISLTSDDDGLRLEAIDDGRGTSELVPGNGISGMRERIKEIGGRLEIMAQPNSGFQINAWMPPEKMA